jgi:hypothetical protein
MEESLKVGALGKLLRKSTKTPFSSIPLGSAAILSYGVLRL